MEKIFETKYGEVILRNVMIDINGTDLIEGIEIKLDGNLIGEEFGYKDIEELTIEEVELYVENHY